MSETPSIAPGRYRHYKGNEYTVLGVARHSETREELVVYRQEYGDHSLWVRPKQMFLETVTSAGEEVPRFQCMGRDHANAAVVVANLLSDIPAKLRMELVETLLTTSTFRIEWIVSHGHKSPEGFWYDQEQHEWVLLLKGAARLWFESGDPHDLVPGDFLNIPAHKRHRVEWTTPDEPTVWLAIRYD